MTGSPERVKIQRSLVQNLSKIQQRLKIIGCFLTFGGLKCPTQGAKKTTKMKSAPSNYSSANFSKIQQLLKNHYLRGGFLTFLGLTSMPSYGSPHLKPEI